MRERLLTWLSSLQIRLIVTYVMVTAISFAMLFFLLRKPVEGVLMNREEKKLEEIAHTLGTTMRTPWQSTRKPGCRINSGHSAGATIWRR